MVWPNFTSTTTSVSVLEDPLFFGSPKLGQQDPRTFFIIELTSNRARAISSVSMVDTEAEILLPPNSRFEVVSVLGPSPDGRLDVQLRELPPTDPIVKF